MDTSAYEKWSKTEHATVYDRWAHYSRTYKGFVIKIKRDFGNTGQHMHLIDGMPCAWGYVVTDEKEFINVMPAATWFQTVKDAIRAIDILIECGGKPVAPYDAGIDSDLFWQKYRNQ